MSSQPPVTPDDLLGDISDWEKAQRQKVQDDAKSAQDAEFQAVVDTWREKHIFSFRQLGDLPPQVPLIHGNILFRRTTAWIAGLPGTYKSFVSLDWAMCIATGRPWLGHAVEQGRVLYVAGEGAAGMHKRGLAWLSRHGLDEDATDDAIDFMGPTNLLDLETRAMLLHLAAEGFWHLVVVDTQARATPGVDENQKDQLDPFIGFLTTLAANHGSTTLTVHHGTKSGSDPLRGSGSILGAADSVFALTRDPDTQLEVQLQILKHKETESGECVMLQLSPHRFGEGDDDVSLIIDPGISQDDLYSAGLGGPSPEDHKKLCGHALAELSAVGSSAYTRTQLAKWLRELGPKLKIKVDYSTAMKVINDLEDRGSVEELRTKMSLTTAGRTLLSWSQSYGFAPGEPAPSRED